MINESNLDWMSDEEEAQIAIDSDDSSNKEDDEIV